MKHILPPLDSLKAFEASARHLSLNRAAEELCVTKGAISYQIRKLEDNIDCALFKRSVRQVYLTDAGQKLLKTTQKLFAEMEQTINKLTQTDNEFDVSIAASTYVAVRWLSPRIAQFNLQHPNVSIVFQHSVNSDEFKLQDVDIALRWSKCDGRSDPNRLLEMPMSLFPVCSPALIDKLKLSSSDKKLSASDISSPSFESIPILCEDRRLDLWQEWYGKQPVPLTNPRRVIADANVRTQAAIDGQGWTLADSMMQHELENGTLIAPFKDQLQGYGYVLMSAPSRYLNQKVKALQSWLMTTEGKNNF